MRPNPPLASMQARSGGPNDATLFRRWQALNDPLRCAMNSLDVSSIVPTDRNGVVQSGDALVQATGARQALLNTTDSAFGNRPTIEFAGAEVYRTAGNFALPTTCTFVHVAENLNGATLSILFESDTSYAASNGGFGHFISGTSVFWNSYYHTSYTERRHASIAAKFINVVAYDPGTAAAGSVPLSRTNDNNQTSTPTAASAAGAWRAQRIQLGGRDAGNSNYWTGAWGCTSIYTGLFNAAQATAEYNYWRAEYSL